ncbi:uncharacterized protein [Zea mays]|uniref:uncharacterized protein n=1 Tax=Zea mays TaxID=4577 RepID=UPI0009A9C809|nr:uncharacterized protein LOC109944553 [Zea mays]|eukprot:XP_020404913.1 uncharacterized protein LOC109944553 [Zea mays]
MATEHRPCCRVPSSPGAVAFLLPPDPNARGQYTIIGEAAAARPTAGAPSRRSVVARRNPASCYAPSPHRPWSTTAFHCEFVFALRLGRDLFPSFEESTVKLRRPSG